MIPRLRRHEADTAPVAIACARQPACPHGPRSVFVGDASRHMQMRRVVGIGAVPCGAAGPSMAMIAAVRDGSAAAGGSAARAPRRGSAGRGRRGHGSGGDVRRRLPRLEGRCASGPARPCRGRSPGGAGLRSGGGGAQDCGAGGACPRARGPAGATADGRTTAAGALFGLPCVCVGRGCPLRRDRLALDRGAHALVAWCAGHRRRGGIDRPSPGARAARSGIAGLEGEGHLGRDSGHVVVGGGRPETSVGSAAVAAGRVKR